MKGCCRCRAIVSGSKGHAKTNSDRLCGQAKSIPLDTMYVVGIASALDVDVMRINFLKEFCRPDASEEDIEAEPRIVRTLPPYKYSCPDGKGGWYNPPDAPNGGPLLAPPSSVLEKTTASEKLKQRDMFASNFRLARSAPGATQAPKGGTRRRPGHRLRGRAVGVGARSVLRLPEFRLLSSLHFPGHMFCMIQCRDENARAWRSWPAPRPADCWREAVRSACSSCQRRCPMLSVAR